MNREQAEPVSPRPARGKRPRIRSALLVALVTVIVGGIASIAVIALSEQWTVSTDRGKVAGLTPVNTELYVDPHMQSIAAAQNDSRFDLIADTPQGKWFTDWSTSATVETDVGNYLAGAEEANAVPMIVLYRIPQRDCGAWSTGGADDEQEYRNWVSGVAAALHGHEDAIVIVEPDALPQLGKCEQGDRLATLRYAVDALSTTGARVYVDAGHENWLSAAETADRLSQVGVNKIRGFSLNVAAHYTTQSEVEFAESVRSELSKRGITDAHYVIDTGRNGAGPQENNCNPPGARLGHEPQLFEGGPLDGFLWVKNPGETDGACQGGPASGFWAPAALSLLGQKEDQPTGVSSAARWTAAAGATATVVVLVWAWARLRRGRTLAQQHGTEVDQAR